MPQATSAVHVIGAGLSGCEAAWQLAKRGISVVLHEMRPIQSTPAHRSDKLGELVCSNSLRSDDSDYNAVGLLHDEMRRLDSLILRAADAHQVPAGGALAVDREAFSETITKLISANPLIKIVRDEITSLPPEGDVIVATGPLTSPALADSLRQLTGTETFSFFDAIAPIVTFDSIDMSKAWLQSRYDKVGPGGDGADYINCAMNKIEYENFVSALIKAEKTEFKEWEQKTPYFEGCLPVEVMAERGVETLRYGPLKPIGLTNPHTTERPHAVVQLRRDNALGTLYNLVGFQTKMKYGEQSRVFRMIPGLEHAEFERLGGVHRNTFINSPVLLDKFLRLKSRPHIRFAGQVTGVEGYVESASMGLLAGLFVAHEKLAKELTPPPRTTSLGALLAHITGDANEETFQPMNVNFGLFPPMITTKKGKGGRERKKELATRAKEDLGNWLSTIQNSVR